jgi:exopolysaccharide production protein ExoY
MAHTDQTFDPGTSTEKRQTSLLQGYFGGTSRNAGAGKLYLRYGKRALDIALVSISLPVLIPVTLLIAILVACDGGSPIFGHSRIGRNGNVFRCWKLRSMVVEAEEKLRDHLANNLEARREWEAGFKLKQDPRITKIGKVLRRLSLDELPQLWNVLLGEMSLVGPRPVTEVELDRYGENLPVYLRQTPGLTGKWQVYGRNAVSYEARIRMDAQYAEECSVLTDIRLIAATVLVVLRKTGV